MKDLSIIIASLILSVSIYMSSNLLANSNYTPGIHFTTAKAMTISVIEKSDFLNQRPIEEITDISTATYKKILTRLAEIEEEHWAGQK